MRLLRTLGILLLSGAGTFSFAQQTPLLSNYYVNPYLSNPALAGAKGSNIFILNRSPWTSGQNNPETFLGTVDGMLANGTGGYGFTLFHDKVNVLGTTGIFGTYSHHLLLTKNSKLSLGFSLGFEQSKILLNRINEDVPSELGISDNSAQKSNLDANFGVNYNLNGINIGLAAYQLFNNNSIETKDEYANNYANRFNRHIVGTASYRIVIKPDVIFIDPMLQVKTSKEFQTQTSISGIGNYKNKVWAGATYRQNYGFDFLAGILIANKLTIGYSYGLATGKAYKNIPTAHEMIIGIKLFKNNSGLDTDKDGIADVYDREPNSPAGCQVNKLGVSTDTDLDRVPDCIDKQNNTPTGAPIDAEGVALDTDKDGVIDIYDRQPATVPGCPVDKFGVAADGDKDEVPDCVDKELNSHWAAKVDADGVALDTDKDGVQDVVDLELETPHWQHSGAQPNSDASKCIVDEHGITKDSDGDGVPDCVDMEIMSPKGAKVNKKGMSLKKQEELLPDQSKDSDGDGISDELDLEPNTPTGSSVDQWGRSPLVSSDPADVHRIEIDEIDDNSSEWDYYVIVGVFRYYNNLKNYQKYLLKTYDESTQVLVTEQNYYYVWTKKITTKNDARSEVDRLSQARLKDYIVGNPWMWRESKNKKSK